MPHIDARSGEVIIRIVYDGAPEAGKTTNVQQLLGSISLQRRGAAQSPGTHGARTEFFDWLDFSGGYLDGRRVRCQLVSVPGQSSLLHRRRYLLETADAIVFVADSRPEAFAESSSNFATTTRLVERVAQGVPLGVVLQANKQDLDGALAAPDVARALGARADTAVVGSVACRGEGVMQTFVLAVRLATDRARALLLERPLPELPPAAEDPQALHAALLELEPIIVEASTEPSAAPPVAPEPDVEHVVLRSEVAETMLLAAETRSPKRTAPQRSNPLRDCDTIALPIAAELGSGHVWPPVKGRAVVTLATSTGLQVPPLLRAWAPSNASELASDAGWTLHTAERWLFGSESLARHRLLTLVRSLLPRIDLLPEGRTFAVARDREQWRLWMITPKLPSLADELLALLEQADVAKVVALVERAALALRALRGFGVSAGVPAGSAGLAVIEGRPALLAVDEGLEGASPEPREPLADLAALLDELALEDTQLTRCASEGRAAIARTRAEQGESR